MQTLRSRLEELIQNKHLLSHHWYIRWQSGKLKMEELQGYAKEYYGFEREFPRFLSAIHSRCDNPEMRKALLQNLVDEEHGDKNHPELWLRFAEGVGVEREQVESHFPSDESEHLVRVFKKHAQSENIADGLAALYAYERQQPDVVRQKATGLNHFYGVSDDRALEFFKAHQKYDVYHAETEISLLEQLCPDKESQDRVCEVVSETLAALYDFLDGVDRRYRDAA